MAEQAWGKAVLGGGRRRASAVWEWGEGGTRKGDMQG